MSEDAGAKPPKAGIAQGFGKVLRNRNFALLWGGQTISWFGDSLYFVALLWLVQELTGSRAMMGLVAACRTIPSLFGFFAGVFIDRWDRRRVMLVSDVGRGVLVAAVPLLWWAGLLRTWHIPVVAFVLASIGVFFYPARQSLLPGLIEREDLTTANSLMVFSQQVIFVVGYALGGVGIALIGTMPMFVVDALTFGVSALAVWSMRVTAAQTRPGSQAVPTDGADKSPGAGLASDLRAGFRFIAHNKALLYIGPLAVVLNFLFSPISVLMPSWVKDVLGGGADLFGFLETAIMAGMAVGSLTVAALAMRFRRSNVIMGGLLGQGVIVVVLAVVRPIPLALAVMAVFGFINALVNVLFMTWMQSVVPRDMMGRVFGALETVSQLATPAGQALAGVLGQVVALPLLYAGSGILTFIVAAFYAIHPTLRAAFQMVDQPARSQSAPGVTA